MPHAFQRMPPQLPTSKINFCRNENTWHHWRDQVSVSGTGKVRTMRTSSLRKQGKWKGWRTELDCARRIQTTWDDVFGLKRNPVFCINSLCFFVLQKKQKRQPEEALHKGLRKIMLLPRPVCSLHLQHQALSVKVSRMLTYQ